MISHLDRKSICWSISELQILELLAAVSWRVQHPPPVHRCKLHDERLYYILLGYCSQFTVAMEEAGVDVHVDTDILLTKAKNASNA
jgi:hypothetical protein